MSDTQPNGEASGMVGLRDLFAGQALTGIIQRPEVQANPAGIASLAFKIADAMLAERAK